MIFKCKNCDGNVLYNPEKGTMHCPFCDGLDCEEARPVPDMVMCPNCSGEIQVMDITSASKCAYCGSYMIFDERVNGEYKPHLILPFKLGKEKVKGLIKKEFKKKIFAPSDFLSEARLSTMEGVYIPFWMYDFTTNMDFQGQGTKVRTWRRGNKEYTETSYYNVVRNIDTTFDRIPVDASVGMNDEIMDLMEPYDYKKLEDFQEKYMSGFFAEKYGLKAEELEPRAKQKAVNDSEALFKGTVAGYTTMVPISKNLTVTKGETEYALLPVWIYSYKYKQEVYPFHVNGQTGKIIGKVPISMKKVWGYTGTVFMIINAIGFLIRGILGV